MAVMTFLQHPFVLFALGCLVTYFVYHRQKNYRRLSYQMSDTFVIDPKIGQDENSLEVRFAGKTVPLVTRTVIRFWNSGTETIHAHDLSAADPLRWQLPDGTIILSVSVDKVTQSANLIATEHNGDRLLLKFDFLDRNDGATVSVLHTAGTNTTKVIGIIKGGKISSQGGAYDVPSNMPVARKDAETKSTGKWVARILTLGVYALFVSSIAITLSGIFPDYFLDTFPYFFSDKPGEPDLVRGRFNLWRTVQGAFLAAVFGGIALAIFDNWKNKPPEKLKF